MAETDSFDRFSIRNEPGGSPLACLHPAWSEDGSLAPEEGACLFDIESLRQRISNLRRAGLDASVSEAALAALQRILAAPAPAAPLRVAAASVLPGAALSLAGAAESATDGLLLVHLAGSPRLTYANPAACRLLGLPPARLIGADPGPLLPGLVRLPTHAMGEWQTIRLRSPEERVQAVRATSLPLRDAAGAMQRLWVLRPMPAGASPEDPTTGLPDRQVVVAALDLALADAAEQRAAAKGPCAAWLRVDRMDALVTRHGEAVREALMLGLADRLVENLRRVDLLARAGATDFLLCLPRVSVGEARAIVARLRAAIAGAPIDTPQGPVRARLRSGVAGPPAMGAVPLVEAARRASLGAARQPVAGEAA